MLNSTLGSETFSVPCSNNQTFTISQPNIISVTTNWFCGIPTWINRFYPCYKILRDDVKHWYQQDSRKRTHLNKRWIITEFAWTEFFPNRRSSILMKYQFFVCVYSHISNISEGIYQVRQIESFWEMISCFQTE